MRNTHVIEAVRGALSALDRPIPHCEKQKLCTCEDCCARRTAVHHCGTCGYTGAPTVYPCDCDETRTRLIGMARAILNEPGETASVTPERRQWCWDSLARSLDDMGMLCSVENPVCPHGSSCCPVCGDAGDGEISAWTDRENAVHAWTIVRELRAALAALQPARRGR